MKSDKSIEDLLNSDIEVDYSLLEKFSEYAPLSKDNEKRIVELGLKKLSKNKNETDTEAVIIENSDRKFISFRKFTAAAASVLIILGVGIGLAVSSNSIVQPKTGTDVSTKESETYNNDKDSKGNSSEINYRSIKDLTNSKLTCISSSGKHSAVYTGLPKIERVYQSDKKFVIFGTNKDNELTIETADNFSDFYLHKDHVICSSGKIVSVIQKDKNIFTVYYIDLGVSGNSLFRMDFNILTEESNVTECDLINNSNIKNISDIMNIYEPDETHTVLVLKDRVIVIDNSQKADSNTDSFDIYKKSIYSTENKIVFSFYDQKGNLNLIVSAKNKYKLVTILNYNKLRSSTNESNLKIKTENVSDFSSEIYYNDFDFMYLENNKIVGYKTETRKSETITDSDKYIEDFDFDNVLIDSSKNIYYTD